MTVFVDTGFFIGTLFPKDQNYRKALQAQQRSWVGVTSTAVVHETLTLLQRRGFFGVALQFLDLLSTDASVQLVYADADLERRGWEEFRRFGSLGASPIDCLSFAIMRRQGIRKAYTFDKHFRAAGFDIL
ncbi:MAG: PIN domain-containing protein [Bryobacteraceae bacterium]|nr:PIN domain-containing protein [Bryobacteraceae bacterium]